MNRLVHGCGPGDHSYPPSILNSLPAWSLRPGRSVRHGQFGSIALCRDIGPLLLPTSGGGTSGVPKLTALCSKQTSEECSNVIDYRFKRKQEVAINLLAKSSPRTLAVQGERMRREDLRNHTVDDNADDNPDEH